MEESDSLNLDLEYKRYLQILRPYLEQLIDKDVISICTAWIQRLSDCNENEKARRNRYILSLCYQLSKGVLEEPFLDYPPGNDLPSITESICSEPDDSSTEVECYVVNPEEPKIETRNKKQTAFTETDCLSHSNDYENTKETSQEYDSDMKSFNANKKPTRKQTIVCYQCPEIVKDNYDSSDAYEHRANNLIKKLRDIKTQNMLLHHELLALKEESTTKHNNSFADDGSARVERATSAVLRSNASSATLKSLKFKLQEVQESRNSLIDKISRMQDTIDNFDDMKKHEIEDIEAKHKLEIINIKTTIRDEVKSVYEKQIEDIKLEFEMKIDCLKNKSSNDIQVISTSKNDVIEEKDKIIMAKDKEIAKLNNQIDDLKDHLHSVLEKFIDKPTNNYNGEDSMKYKAELLEKRLNRMEKNKMKYTRIYETKIAQLQREKHLAECSLQLQMVRQRTQVVNEVTDENQSELSSALDKLETKYKDIVANVQATAIQRRMQDQMALESILQAACSIPSENDNSPGANGQFPKPMRNQNPSCDGAISPLTRGNKVGNICIGNKSFEQDSLVTGYCLNGERMGELFERVYIPQRDNPDNMK